MQPAEGLQTVYIDTLPSKRGSTIQCTVTSLQGEQYGKRRKTVALQWRSLTNPSQQGDQGQSTGI